MCVARNGSAPRIADAACAQDVIRQLATPAPLPPSTDALKQILIGAVRYFEMQRLDEIQVATRQHVSTPMHLVTVADHNVFGYPLGNHASALNCPTRLPHTPCRIARRGAAHAGRRAVPVIHPQIS